MGSDLLPFFQRKMGVFSRGKKVNGVKNMYETRNIGDEKILQNKNKIKATRIELLRLMALDDEWHRDETSELYKKI
ncbi:MAG: hypothetical protein E7E99_09095, partial [Peptoniphilus lacydonensis]|nr:hypothetical protein [Peptoniphilus lacydonensis]MDU8953556.1 hypothetical protein [Streptococcus sp.]